MRASQVTNQTINTVDWSFTERQRMIQIASRRSAGQTGATPVPSVWMVDMSASDRRSIKAQLAGRRSLRAAWWNLFSAIHQRFSRTGSLEGAMHAYHRLHHAITLCCVQISHDYRKYAHTVHTHGLVKAMADYMTGDPAELKRPPGQ